MLFFDLPNFPKLFFRKNRNFLSFVTNNTRTRVQNEQIFTLRRQNYNKILLNKHKRSPKKKWKNPQKKSRFLKKISFPNHFFSRSPILLFTDQCKNIKNQRCETQFHLKKQSFFIYKRDLPAVKNCQPRDIFSPGYHLFLIKSLHSQ